MNIAILIPELGGGGAERVAQRIGNFFVEQGNQVYYFLGDYGILPRYEVKGTIVKTGIPPIFPWRMNSYFLLWSQLWDDSRRMKSYKKKYKIDVSISFMEHFNALNVLSRCGDKVITRVCTILSARALPGVLYNRHSLHFLYAHADAVIVMTTDGKDEMISLYGVSKNLVHVIPNPIHLQNQSIDDVVSYRRRCYSEKIILVIGRLESVKQQDHIIRAFSAVVKKIPDAQLILLGQGPLESYLKELTSLYHLEGRIHFLGFIKDMDPYFACASGYVMTSKCEGFPNSLVEAMTWGIPIIAADAPGGCRDILDSHSMNGEGVRIAPYGIMTEQLPVQKVAKNEPLLVGEKYLAKAMVQVLTDQMLFLDLVEKSYSRAQEYEINKVMKLWRNVL